MTFFIHRIAIFFGILVLLHCQKKRTISSFNYHKSWTAKKLYAGFGKQNIRNIPKGTYMAGYAPFRKSNGKISNQSPVQVRAVYLGIGELHPKNQQSILLLSTDLLGITGDQVQNIKNLIRKHTGLSTKHIFISATHNHSGPDSIGLWGGINAQVKKNITSAFLKSSLEAFDDAFHTKKISTLYFAQTPTDIPAINRRKPESKLIPNQMSVIHFKKRDDKNITAIFYAAHPVILGPDNQTISGDFPARFVQKAEKKFQDNFIYFNGALGDVNPPPINKNVYNRTGGGEKEIENFSEALIQSVQKAFLSLKKLSVYTMSIQTKDMKFEPKNQFLLQLALGLGFVGSVRDQYGLFLAPVTRISFSPRLNLITVPGELFKHYEYKLKKQFPEKKIFLIGLCDDSLGYFLPRKEMNQAGGLEEKFVLNPANGENWYRVAQKVLNSP